MRKAEERRVARRKNDQRDPRSSPSIRAGAMAALQERRDSQNLTEWEKQMAAIRAFTECKLCDGGDDLKGKNATSALECAICLGSLLNCTIALGSTSGLAEPAPGSEILALPCGSNKHVFHASCLEPWLKKSFRCPLCRADLRPLL